jgi:hypothetical protein
MYSNVHCAAVLENFAFCLGLANFRINFKDELNNKPEINNSHVIMETYVGAYDQYHLA